MIGSYGIIERKMIVSDPLKLIINRYTVGDGHITDTWRRSSWKLGHNLFDFLFLFIGRSTRCNVEFLICYGSCFLNSLNLRLRVANSAEWGYYPPNDPSLKAPAGPFVHFYMCLPSTAQRLQEESFGCGQSWCRRLRVEFGYLKLMFQI